MDVHRCRFVPYPTSTINAVAFSHASAPNKKGKGPSTLRLAVGRANGDIEIWNPLKGIWLQETIIRGGKNRSIQGLVWTHDPEEEGRNGQKLPGALRLFSTGFSTSITEWNLALGKPRRHVGANYGEIWCLAAQPRRQDLVQAGHILDETKGDAEIEFAQHLVVGCADGTLVLFSTGDDDLKFQKILARPSKRKARVLCIAFQTRNVIVAGYADSTLRVFDIRNGRQLQSMSLGAGPRGGPSEILVWSVKCLPNGTIVSGDSTGEVKFWDAKTYALSQRIKSHEADILDVVTSADGNTVVSGGMDRRTAIHKPMGKQGQRRARWAEISHQRFHSHDVKAMATFETRDMSVLVSGGLDSKLVILPLREYGKENSRGLTPLPRTPPLQSSPSQRLIVSWWDREVSIWRLKRSPSVVGLQDSDCGLEDSQAKKLVAKISLQGEESITSAALCSNGSVLAVSTVSETKIFNLTIQSPEKSNRIKVQKLQCPATLSAEGAKLLQFSPDAKWLAVIRNDSSVQVHRLTKEETDIEKLVFSGQFAFLHRLRRERKPSLLECGSLGNYEQSIDKVVFSADSRILVTGDLSGNLDSWVLEGHEELTLQTVQTNGIDKTSAIEHSEDEAVSDDEDQPTIILGQHWMRNPAASLLPKLPSAPVVLSFRPLKTSDASVLTNGTMTVHPTRHNPNPHSHDLPRGEDRLFALTSEHQIHEIEVLSGKLSDWSRRNPFPNLPPEFKETRDRAVGCVWNVAVGRERIWLYGSTWLWMFDLSQDFPSPSNEAVNGHSSSDGALISAETPRKRKRAARDKDTGAGSRIADHESNLGLTSDIRKLRWKDIDQSKWMEVGRGQSSDSDGQEDDDDDDDDDDARFLDNGDSLLALRRKTDDSPGTNGHLEDTMDLDDSKATRDENTLALSNNEKGSPYWHTYKYRPILGIVPLGTEQEMENRAEGQDGDGYGSSMSIEVALVERPSWDTDLPPRYQGNQEWIK